jgi:hypothetical protein
VTSTKTWPRRAPGITALAEADQDFLVGTGLEVGSFGHLDVSSELETTEHGVVLAHDSATAIACTAAGVVALEEVGERLVNTSAERFVASMRRMARYADEVQAAPDDDEELRLVEVTIADLRAIDPEAWASDRSYWPVVGEQMIAGML